MEVMTGMNMGMWKGCGCFDMSVWTGLNPYRLCAGRRDGSWVVTGWRRMAGAFCGASQTMRGGKVTRVYYCRGYQTLRSAVCTNKDRVDKAEVERFVLGEIKGCIRQMLKEGISVDGDMLRGGCTGTAPAAG